MTPTPPSGIPTAIADQLHRDDGQDRGIRGIRRLTNAALGIALAALVGALIAATTPRRPVALAPSPVVHVAAAPPCPACPPCAACPACPQPTGRHR